jgi:hypothetical protein
MDDCTAFNQGLFVLKLLILCVRFDFELLSLSSNGLSQIVIVALMILSLILTLFLFYTTVSTALFRP